MRYGSLFSLQTIHGYYRDGISPELRLIPTPAALQFLKNNRMKLVERPGGVNVVFPFRRNNIDPLVAWPSGTVFRFFLSVKGPFFSSITTLSQDITFSEIFAKRSFLYFNNFNLQAGEVNLEQQLIQPTQTEFLEVASSINEEPFFLKNRPLSSLGSNDFRIEGLGVENPSAYEEDSKRLLIDTSGAEAGAQFSVTYRSKPNWPTDVVGLVEIDIGSSTDVGVPRNFRVNFSATSIRWRYYVVYDDANAQISIEDESGQANGNLAFVPTVIATEDEVVHTEIDFIDQKIIDHYISNEILRFDSSAPVLSREAPYRNLRLTMTIAGTPPSQLVMNHLPNPSPVDGGVEIINLLT